MSERSRSRTLRLASVMMAVLVVLAHPAIVDSVSAAGDGEFTIDVEHENGDQADEVNSVIIYQRGEGKVKEVGGPGPGNKVNLKHTFSDLSTGNEYKITAYIQDQFVGETDWIPITQDTFYTPNDESSVSRTLTAESPVEVTVRAYHEDGSTPLADAEMTIESHEPGDWREGTTGENGYARTPANNKEFFLYPTNKGSYTIEISDDGEQVGSKQMNTLDGDRDIEITTDVPVHELDVDTDGSGGLEVSPPGLSARSLDREYGDGAEVELTAIPGSDHQFAGWEGEIGAVDNDDKSIEVTMDRSRDITAKFEKETHELQVTTRGEGSVRINPPSTRTQNEEYSREYTDGTSVTLRADPDSGTQFTGWEGEIGTADPSSRRLEVTMSDSRDITATFEKKTSVFFTVSRESTIPGYGFSGDPIRDAQISIEISSDPTRLTDTEGGAKFTLAPGEYEYAVTADGFERHTGTIDVPGEGALSQSVGLVQSGTGSLTVNVRDQDGNDVAAYKYQLFADGSRLKPNTAGEVILDAGTHQLSAKPTDAGGDKLTKVSKTVTVEAGESSQVTLVPFDTLESVRPADVSVSLSAVNGNEYTGNPMEITDVQNLTVAVTGPNGVPISGTDAIITPIIEPVYLESNQLSPETRELSAGTLRFSAGGFGVDSGTGYQYYRVALQLDGERITRVISVPVNEVTSTLDTPIKGWQSSIEQQVIVKNEQYTAVRMDRYDHQRENPNRPGYTWVIYDKNGELVTDTGIIRKASQAATVSQFTGNEDQIEQFLSKEYPNTLERLVTIDRSIQYAELVRDTSANTLGTVTRAYATGGSGVAAQAATGSAAKLTTRKATKLAAKELAKQIATEIANSDVTASDFLQDPMGTYERLTRRIAFTEMKASADQARQAGAVLEDHRNDEPWSYEQSQQFWRNYNESIIDGNLYSQARAERLSGSNTVKDTLISIGTNFAEGASGAPVTTIKSYGEFVDLLVRGKLGQGMEAAMTSTATIRQNHAVAQQSFDERPIGVTSKMQAAGGTSLDSESPPPSQSTSAEITIQQLPRNTVSVGGSADLTVSVTNTGSSTDRFFVGYSVAVDSGEATAYYDNKGTTGRFVTVNPGRTQTVKLGWTASKDAPRNVDYDVITAVWSDYPSKTTTLNDKTRQEDVFEVKSTGGISITRFNTPERTTQGSVDLTATIENTKSIGTQVGVVVQNGERKLGTPTVLFVPANGERTITLDPRVEATGTRQLKIVAGSKQATATDTVEVVSDPNRDELIAYAGPDQTVTAGKTVKFDASGSTAPDNSALSYRFQQVSRSGSGSPPDVSLQDPETRTPEFTAPDVDSETTLMFELTITKTDSTGTTTDTDTDQVNITITPADDPLPTTSLRFTDQTISSGSATLSVDTAQFGNQTVPGEKFVVVVHKTTEETYGDGIGPKIGESDVLPPGTRQSVEVDLSRTLGPSDDIAELTESQSLVAMLHRADTDDGDNINHGSHITRNGDKVTSRAQVTVSSPPDKPGLGAAWTIPMEYPQFQMTTGDVDGDGSAELAVGNHGSYGPSEFGVIEQGQWVWNRSSDAPVHAETVGTVDTDTSPKFIFKSKVSSTWVRPYGIDTSSLWSVTHRGWPDTVRAADTDNDGKSEMAVMSHNNGYLTVIGDSGDVLWRTQSPANIEGLFGLTEVTGDDTPEILTHSPPNDDKQGLQLISKSTTGGVEVVWRAEPNAPVRATLSELDSDTDASEEVIAAYPGRGLITSLDAETGEMRWREQVASADRVRFADVTGNETPEVLLWSDTTLRVFSADSRSLIELSTSAPILRATGSSSGSGDGTLLLLTENALISRTAEEELTRIQIDATQVNEMSVGDTDGDNNPEVALGTGGSLRLYDNLEVASSQLEFPSTPESESGVDVTRTVSSSEVPPNEQVTVTTEITGVSGAVSTTSSYDLQVASATVQSVTVNGASASPITATAEVGGSVVTLGDVGTDATIRITEELTVGEKTDVTHSITGNVTIGETTVEIDPVSVTVADIEPQSVVGKYDSNDDGTISITELGVAGADFARGELTITELGRLGAEFASSS